MILKTTKSKQNRRQRQMKICFFDKKKKGKKAKLQPSFQFYVIVFEKPSAIECAVAAHSKNGCLTKNAPPQV